MENNIFYKEFLDFFGVDNYLNRKIFLKKDNESNNLFYFILVPGLSKENIEIKNINNELVIILHYEKCDIEFLKSKTPYKTYIESDDRYDFAKTKAKLENGVLKIVVPEFSDDSKKTNKIEIE